MTTTKLGLRAASRLHDVPHATLRRYILSGGTVSVQGRHPCLDPAEEKIIADAALEFAGNGTPLSRECLKDMMQHFIQHLRAVAMSPQNLAEHFARLQQMYREFRITSGAQIFNLDESGYSTRTVFRARAKAAMQSQGRSNSTELKWSSNAAHVTIMPVVSADGTLWTPIAILPGKRAKYKIRANGLRETPASYLP